MTLTCGCGVAFENTPSGRWRHRVIVGHTASAATEIRASWRVDWDAVGDEKGEVAR